MSQSLNFRARVLPALLAVVWSCGALSSALAQMPFFPGAEGYGGTFLGSAPAAGWFSNATVYHVTNLNDSGPGSFRDAFDENTSNRIIVFDVAGTIHLSSDNVDIKNLSNYYIAGQTAPGPITIYGRNTQVTHSSDKDNTNVVLRYLTFRKGTGDDEDSLSFAGGSNPSNTGRGQHMIFDHVSVSWSEDENLSVANNNTNITVQHSIIADALGGSHAYASLIRPRSDSNVSFHHNLYANNRSRQPRLGTYNDELLTADIRNNVVYNWSDRATYAGGSSSGDLEHVDVNYVGNYLIAGPATANNADRAFVVDKNVDLEAYQSGNLIDSDNAPGGTPNDNTLNGTDTGWGMFTPVGSVGAGSTFVQRATPFEMAPVTTQDATSAYNDIIQHAGNSRWGREAIDARIVGNVENFTSPANGVAATEPIANELDGVLNAPQLDHPVGWDTDGDAMPDDWELAHGLDPNNGSDWNLDFDTDGYINLIEYINERGEFPATAPIDFVGGASTRYADIMNWKTNDGGMSAGTNWQPSRFDVARIHTGAVVVDAVGQHAGTLKLAPNGGDNATLDVSSGWLAVADGLHVGSDTGSGTLEVASGATVLATFVEVAAMGAILGEGEIVAEVLNFGLVSPGSSAGVLSVAGDFRQGAEGTLLMEIASAADFDQLEISGILSAGGTLEVELLGYEPLLGDTFDLLDFASSTGSFTLDLPELAVGLAWDSDDLLTTGALSVIEATTLPGDFDGDGDVDGQDFLVWQRDPVVGSLQDWQNSYGNASSVAAHAATVPEPSTLLLLILAATIPRPRGTV